MERIGDDKALRKLAKGPTPTEQRLIDASANIAIDIATSEDACYLHTILCQVGMPRKRTTDLTFERTSGMASIRLIAGTVFTGRKRVQQPLPYGPKPRLILINLTATAVRTGSRVIDVGRSTRQFMERMGLDPQGSEYRSLRTQIAALSACHMELGWADPHRGVTVNMPSVNPIRRFEVWLDKNPDQQAIWPQTVELTQEYFDGLQEHAVPLDERAVAALRGSALALDVYTWLGHRLCRVGQKGQPIRWRALKSQFGQEYDRMDHFRERFRDALQQVLAVYPDARISEETDGIRLEESPPPIPKIRVFLP